MSQLLIREGQEVAVLALFDTYNHNGKSPDRSLRRYLSYARQKGRFHFANLRALSGLEQAFYLKIKTSEAYRRTIGRAHVAWINLLNLIRLRRLERLSFIEDINDQAAFAYRPRPYPGKVFLFKHERNFSFLADPGTFGWKGLPTEGLEVFDVPASPGGMFMEPYLQVLASRLKACLEEAHSEPPRFDWEDRSAPGGSDGTARSFAK
jgi:thioesterase domain-containing protein